MSVAKFKKLHKKILRIQKTAEGIESERLQTQIEDLVDEIEFMLDEAEEMPAQEVQQFTPHNHQSFIPPQAYRKIEPSNIPQNMTIDQSALNDQQLLEHFKQNGTLDPLHPNSKQSKLFRRKSRSQKGMKQGGAFGDEDLGKGERLD